MEVPVAMVEEQPNRNGIVYTEEAFESYKTSFLSYIQTEMEKHLKDFIGRSNSKENRELLDNTVKEKMVEFSRYPNHISITLSLGDEF